MHLNGSVDKLEAGVALARVGRLLGGVQVLRSSTIWQSDAKPQGS
jgi:hypothetical protein